MLSALAPALVIVVISIYFHGDQHTAFSIYESWKPLLTKDCSKDYENLAAISAVGWNLKWVMTLVKNIFFSPLIIVWLALLIF